MADTTSTSTDKPGLTSNKFVTSAKDTLAAVDVYTRKQVTNTQTTINSAKDQYESGAKKYEDAVRQGQDQINKVEAAKTWVATGRKIISTKTGLDRITSLSTTLQSGLKAAGLETELTNSVFKLVSSSTSVYAKVNGQITKIKTKDLPKLKKVLAIISKFLGTDSSEITDTATKIGTCAALIIKALESNTIGCWSIATSTFGTDTASLKKVAKLILPTVIKKTAASTLYDMASTLGDKLLLTINSLVIREFCKAYSKPSTITDEAAFYLTIVNAFDAVDSGWRTFTRTTTDGDEDSLVLLPLIYASSDCKKLFLKYAKFDASIPKQMILLGTLFTATTVKTQLKSDFKSLVISDDQITA